MRWLVAPVLVGVVSILALAGVPGDAYRHSDFFQFWAAPRLVLEGSDPYERGDWASIYEREAAAPVATPPPPGRHIYPAWTTALGLPLGAVPLELAAATWLVAQLVVVAWALRALARLFALDRATSLVLYGIAAAFQPLWLMVGGGNTTGFLFGLVVAALVWVSAGAPGRAGIAMGLLAVKPHPFLALVPAILLAARGGDRLRVIAAGVVTGGLLLAITLPFGLDWIGEWLGASLERADVHGSNATAWTLDRVIPVGPWLPPLLAAVSMAALIAWAVRTRPSGPALVAGAVPVSLFVAPHGWSYDQLHLLVTYAAVLAAAITLEGARRLALLVATALLAGPVPWALYALAIPRSGEEWSAVTPLLCFALMVVASVWSRQGTATAPLRSRP